MKKVLASLGVIALVALGATGASFPATAASVQPAVEIVAEADAIIASPDAVLVHAKPAVATVAAPVVRVAPKAPKARVTAPKAPKPVAVAPKAPVAPAAPVVPVCYEEMPCWDCETMGNHICGPVAPVAVLPPQVHPRPTSCPAPTLKAEDGSCVNPDFWK